VTAEYGFFYRTESKSLVSGPKISNNNAGTDDRNGILELQALGWSAFVEDELDEDLGCMVEEHIHRRLMNEVGIQSVYCRHTQGGLAKSQT
jgi:hypothetical protein